MAGPLRTAESILSEVSRIRRTFRCARHGKSPRKLPQTNPTERLTILAEYSQSDRSLQIQGFEKEQ